MLSYKTVKYRLQGTFYCTKNGKKTTYYWSPTFYLQIKSRTPVKSPLLLLSHPDSKSTANQYFTHFATKVRLFIRAGLYPNSQKIHVKQGAGRYFHITSFDDRVIHFLSPEIHHISNNWENLSPFWEILMKYRPF